MAKRILNMLTSINERIVILLLGGAAKNNFLKLKK